MAVIKSIPKQLVLLLALVSCSQCLYEDQIGKFDWRKTHLGKLRYASFDSVKRIVVATEENVLASLNLKNGQVAWRHLLESPETYRVELLHVDNEVLTVTGNGNINYVRGWDLNTGTLLYEWSMITEKPNARWVVTKTHLVHLVPVPKSHVEVTEYQIRTGANKGSTSKLSTPWINDLDKCAVAGTYWTCISSENTLYSIDLSGELAKVHKQSLASLIGEVSGNVEILEIKHAEAAVLLRRNNINRFVLIAEKSTVLPYSLEHNVISVSNGDDNSLMQIEYGDENTIQIKNFDVGSDENTIIPLDLPENLPHLTLVTGICRGTNCRVLFKCADDSISLLQLPSGKVQWTREEALSQVIAAEFIELPLSESEASIEREFNEASSDIFSMFTRRIFSQLRQLTIFLSGQKASTQNELVRDMFGLHKLIILATSVGKIFAVDTISGEVIWSRFVPELVPFKVMGKDSVLLYEQRTARHAPLLAQMILIGKDASTTRSVLFSFDPITGKSIGDIIKLPYRIKQSMLIPYEDKNHIKGLLLLAEDNHLHVYPPSAKTTVYQHSSTIFLYNADTEKASLDGYTLYFSSDENPRATPTWHLNLAGSQIVAISTRPSIERVHSQGRVLADRSVFYKYINPNLVAIATITPDVLHRHVLSIYLVDGVTGLIVHSAHHKRANGPVHMVHSENWLVYSYFSERFRRFEVTAVELYEGARQSNSTAFSSHALSQLPHPETLSYIIPVNPLAMVATLTERGITNKHILIALSSGSVIEMPWAFLEPRGPHLPSNPEEGYIPYLPELPIHSEGIINYNQTLGRIKGIQVSPARLESTSLVIVYGLDLFYTRVTPSKTFDVLKEDFDHWLIVMVLVGLTFASYITKRLSIRKALKQVWK